MAFSWGVFFLGGVRGDLLLIESMLFFESLLLFGDDFWGDGLQFRHARCLVLLIDH